MCRCRYLDECKIENQPICKYVCTYIWKIITLLGINSTRRSTNKRASKPNSNMPQSSNCKEQYVCFCSRELESLL